MVNNVEEAAGDTTEVDEENKELQKFETTGEKSLTKVTQLMEKSLMVGSSADVEEARGKSCEKVTISTDDKKKGKKEGNEGADENSQVSLLATDEEDGAWSGSELVEFFRVFRIWNTASFAGRRFS